MNSRRLLALVSKESLQIVRDPSAILIAFVLPVLLLFLFAYAVSLDIRQVHLGVVLQSDSARAQSLAAEFSGTPYFRVVPVRHRKEVTPLLVSGELKGYVLIPADFDRRLFRGDPLIQVITDGTQPNTANFVAGYTRGVLVNWLSDHGLQAPIRLDARFWFNPEVETRKFLVPGAIAIIMTMIGTLLTALVVAREWERGTMEALLSTPARIPEILLGKLLPYFGLGLVATMGSTLLAIHIFDVPLRGSWAALLSVSSCFLVPALGQGLVISALARNQFIAAQAALFSGFLPAFLLSGFLFEIDAMPAPIRWLTHIVPARYFIESLHGVFLVGDVWSLLLQDMFAMLGLGTVMFVIARVKTRKSLE